MNSPDPASQSDSNDPERLLRTRLRRTTPEFEQRFDDLRRQLAQEPQPDDIWSRFWAPWFRNWRVLSAVGVVAACLIGAFLFQTMRRAPTSSISYGELIALNDTLEAAVPLADEETRTSVLLLPNQTTH